MTTTVLLEEKQKEKEANLMTFKFLMEDAWRKFKRKNILRNLLFVGIILVSSLIISEINNLARKNEVQNGNLIINTKFENNLPKENQTKEDKEDTKENIKEDEEVKAKPNSNENVYMLVNINTASSQMLQSLNGIGESYAMKIIEYRKANGPFTKIEDIKNVKGIGDAKFNKIKKYIEV